MSLLAPDREARPFVGVPIAEVDLARGLRSLDTSTFGRASHALLLVRLHGHPLGSVALDLAARRPELDWTEQIIGSLSRPLARHLASDRPSECGKFDVWEGGSWRNPCCRVLEQAARSLGSRITVIVATRHRPSALRRCIDSLLAMDYPNFEVLVVDNAPDNDEAQELVLSEYVSSGQVRYLREEVRGLAAAHNCGLASATGEIVAFTDDDVIVDRSWLAALSGAFLDRPEVLGATGLIFPAELETPAQVALELHGNFAKGYDARDFDLFANRPADRLFPLSAGRLGSGANMAFRRDFLEHVGGFDVALGAGSPARGGDDLAALCSLILAGGTLAYRPSAIVWHHHRREFAALRRQAFNYGIGFGAYATSVVCRRRRLGTKGLGSAVGDSLRQPQRASAVSSPPPALTGPIADKGKLPRALAILQILGILLGPFAYLKSQRRNGNDRPAKWSDPRPSGDGLRENLRRRLMRSSAPKGPIDETTIDTRPSRRSSSLASDLGEPLFRNGHALILSSIATSGIGLFFWILAARNYSPNVVGLNTVLLSTLTFIGGIAQLNLAGALIRFLPEAGAHRHRLIVGSYALSAAASCVLALGFVLVIRFIVPSLGFLSSDLPLGIWWVAATAIWSVFVIEDGALTGLRKARWVPVENSGFSVLKTVLVVPFALVFHSTGIFVAWTFAALCTVIPTNLYLFGKAIPSERVLDGGDVSIGRLTAYVRYDYIAQLCWLAATGLLPLVVIHEAGAAASAFYQLAWVIAYSLYLVSINIGSSMIVESAANQEGLTEQCRRVIAHLLKLLLPAVFVIEVGASEILRLFGPAYAAASATTLRLLALSAVPFVLNSTAVSSLRARRRTRDVLFIDATICVLVTSLTFVLLPTYGILATGISWLVAQSLVAIGVLAARRSWMGIDAPPPPPPWLANAGLAAARAVLRTPIGRAPASSIQPSAHRDQIQLVKSRLPEFVNALRGDVGEAAGTLNELEVRSRGTDLIEVQARLDNAGEVATVFIAQSPDAEQRLRHEAEVIDTLAHDDELGQWRTLLPKMTFLEGSLSPTVVARWASGIQSSELLRSTPLRAEVRRVGIEVIDEFHAASAEQVRLDEGRLQTLLGESLKTLRRTHPSGHVPATQALAIDRLEERLLHAAVGCRADVGWVHGDYSPECLFMESEASAPTALVHWSQARANGLQILDDLSWVTCTSRAVARRELGSVVCEFLANPQSRSRRPRAVESLADRLGIPTSELVYWSWLDHVAGNINRSTHYRRHPMWWTANVEPVLETVRP